MIRLKNEKQIDGIRESCKLLARLFEDVLPKIVSGMSTFDIDEMCRLFIQKHGGTPAWYREQFPGASNISINNQVIHGVPSKKRIIKTGDIVSVDVGIDLNGYISDASRTIAIGTISDEAYKLIEIT
ncbi:MAG: M24 family metallopeptidase, partial [Spirochaetales bacterium]